MTAGILSWLDFVAVTGNPSECPMADCEFKKQQQQQTDRSRNHAGGSQHENGAHSDDDGDCPYGGDPDICDCDVVPCCEHDCKSKQMAGQHRNILSKIKEIEETYSELTRAVDETLHLRLPINHGLKIDPVMKNDVDFQTKLKRFNSNCVLFGLNHEPVQAPLGRPFCPVWCKKAMYCHIAKINRYSPTNCNCTKDHKTGNTSACPCFSCVLRHVEHCAEDYKDALRRVKLGVTKLQAVPRKDAGVMPSASAESGNVGGSAMPGVRKAKHIKKFTEAQKKAYNRGH
ncbi:hypothetical protein LTR85_006657 [Meristemomyces frigidus]|nr:hypothetical protein LTR85_006657 [Meristemomyces frigidus]